MKSKAARLVFTHIINSVFFGNSGVAIPRNLGDPSNPDYTAPSLQDASSGGYFQRWWQISTQIRRSYQEGITNVTISFKKDSNELDVREIMGSAWPYVTVAAVLALVALISLFVLPILLNQSVHLAKRKQKRSAFVPVKRNSSRVSPLSSLFLAIASLFTVCGIVQVYYANQLFNISVFHFTSAGLATVDEAWTRGSNLSKEVASTFDSMINTVPSAIDADDLDVPKIMSPIRDPAERAAEILTDADQTRVQLESLSVDLSLLQSDLSNQTSRLDAQLKRTQGVLQSLSGNRNISGPPVSVYVYQGQASPLMSSAGPWTVQNYSALTDLADSFATGGLPSNSSLASAKQTIADAIQSISNNLNGSMDTIYNEFENASIVALEQAETTLQTTVLNSPEFRTFVAQLNETNIYAHQDINPKIQRSDNVRSYVTLVYLAIILGLAIVSYFAICKVRADVIKCIATLLCIFVGFSFLLCAVYLLLGVSIDTLCNYTYDETQTRYFATFLRTHDQEELANRIELLADLSDACAPNGGGLLTILEDRNVIPLEAPSGVSDDVEASVKDALGLKGIDPSDGQEQFSSLPKSFFDVAPVAQILDRLRQVANSPVVSDEETISNLTSSLKLAFDDLQAQDFEILSGRASRAEALEDFSPVGQDLVSQLQSLQSSTADIDAERTRFAAKIQEISSYLERAATLDAQYGENINAAISAVGNLSAANVQADLIPRLRTVLLSPLFDGTSLLERIGNCSFVNENGKALRASVCTQTLMATDGLALSHGQLGTYVLMFVICLFVMARRIVLTTPKEPSGGEFVVISSPTSRNGTIRSTKSGKGGTYRSVKTGGKSGTLRSQRSIKASRPYEDLEEFDPQGSSPDHVPGEWPGQHNHHHYRLHHGENPITPTGTYGRPVTRASPRNGGYLMEEYRHGRNIQHPVANHLSDDAGPVAPPRTMHDEHPPVYLHDYEFDRRGSGDTMH